MREYLSHCQGHCQLFTALKDSCMNNAFIHYSLIILRNVLLIFYIPKAFLLKTETLYSNLTSATKENKHLNAFPEFDLRVFTYHATKCSVNCTAVHKQPQSAVCFIHTVINQLQARELE